MAEWELTEPTTLELDELVRTLEVRLVSGHIDVVTAAGDGATVEVSSVKGGPLTVIIDHGSLSILHPRSRGDGWLGWFRLGRGSDHHAVVSVAVPAACTADVGVVSADAVVSGVEGWVSVKTVSGDVTLDGAVGSVVVDSVSGDVEARGLVGDLTVKSVTGELTVVDARPSSLRAKNISGDITVDLQAAERGTTGGDPGVRIDVSTVSGDLTVRVPGDVDLQVDVASTSGDISSAFGDLTLVRRPGAHRLQGRLGAGAGALHGRTVSGRVALLSRDSGLSQEAG